MWVYDYACAYIGSHVGVDMNVDGGIDMYTGEDVGCCVWVLV